MKIVRENDEGREVFYSAIPVWDGDRQGWAGAFKLDDPPGMLGGEFVKDKNGHTKMFNAEQYAIDAARELYESRK